VRFLTILTWCRGFNSRIFVLDVCNCSPEGDSIAKDSRSVAPTEDLAIISGALMIASRVATDVGTMVGRLVSYTMRSGHFRSE
jgi:hypothetical protein